MRGEEGKDDADLRVEGGGNDGRDGALAVHHGRSWKRRSFNGQGQMPLSAP